MREWIRFGAVVLVVDYFLELTFFSTVLSIDIQRLELADLLAQKPSPGYEVLPSTEAGEKGRDKAFAAASVGTSVKSAWKVLRDRPAKTSTVAFLWAINLMLWALCVRDLFRLRRVQADFLSSSSYGSEHYLPAVCSQTALSSDRPFLAPSLSPDITRSLRLGQTSDPSSSSYLDIPTGAASAFWQLVNPSNATSVQVYLEPTVSIQFFDEDILAAPESIDLLFPTESAPSIVTKVGLVLLPIAVVMALLYLLLLYLLKDAELLQAHWGSEERLGGPGRRKRRRQEAEKKADAGVKVVKQMSARHVNDVELIASGGDVVASWAALEDCILVRRLHGASITLDLPVEAEPAVLSALVVDSKGRFCAAATAAGRVHVWPIADGGAPVRLDDTCTNLSPVVALAVLGSAGQSGERLANGASGATMNGSDRSESDDQAGFFALRRDGTVTTWTPTTGESTISSLSPREDPSTRTSFVTPNAAGSASTTPLLARASPDGRLQLASLHADNGETVFDGSVGRTGARLTALAVSRAEEGVVAVGYSDGHVVFRSLTTPTILLAKTRVLGGPVRRLQLLPAVQGQTCSDCGERIEDGFVAVVSAHSDLKVLRVYTPPAATPLEQCKCNTDDVAAIARSRSSSMGVVGSPAMIRTLSNGTSRRFSPRKKPPTPIRPQQQHSALGDSPIRPRASQFASNGSSSSSGSSSPTRDRSLNGLSLLATPAPPPPMAASPSASQPSSPKSSSHPLAPDSDTIASLDSATSASEATMRCVEVASVPLDERGGWAVMAGRLVGFRRARSLEVAGQRGWEVWTVSLGRTGASYDEGYEEGTASLADVLQAEREEAEAGTTEVVPSSGAPSTVRQRRTSAAAALRSPRASLSTTRPSSIRFAENTPDLPFSRARPVVTAMDGKAVSVALGNRVVVLRSAKKQGSGVQQQQSGFLGL